MQKNENAKDPIIIDVTEKHIKECAWPIAVAVNEQLDIDCETFDGYITLSDGRSFKMLPALKDWDDNIYQRKTEPIRVLLCERSQGGNVAFIDVEMYYETT